MKVRLYDGRLAAANVRKQMNTDVHRHKQTNADKCRQMQMKHRHMQTQAEYTDTSRQTQTHADASRAHRHKQTNTDTCRRIRQTASSVWTDATSRHVQTLDVCSRIFKMPYSTRINVINYTKNS